MYADEKKFGEVTEPKVDKVGQVLLDAADYIEKHGWVRGSFHNSEGVCIWGAILMVRKPNSIVTDACLQRMYKTTGQGIIGYNDFTAKNKQEVIAMLRKAAVNG